LDTKQTNKESSGITIVEAYDQLSRTAFALWIRLAVHPAHELETLGMYKLAKKFGYSRRTFYDQIQILRNSGYLRYVSQHGRVAKIRLTKKPLLIGVDQFIKLS
jgi:transposase